jgi:glycosyltransferase involved in cell wall biosynthesis
MYNTIRFSVIIPLYNKEATLLRTLESVAAQKTVAFEILVVDNGSTDTGPALATAFGAPVRLLQISDRGVSQARNAGINAAQGDFMVFLDADDSWEPDFLTTLQALINDFPEAGWYAIGYAFKWENRLKAPQQPLPKNFSRGYLPNYFELVTKGDMVATASSVAIDAKVCQSMGGFAVGERIGEDQDLWARIALQYPVAFDKKVCAYYHQDALNMATRSEVQTQAWPFIKRIAQQAAALQHPQLEAVYDYLGRHLVGQASQLVLAKNYKAAQHLLQDPLAQRQGMRFFFWKLRAWLGL